MGGFSFVICHTPDPSQGIFCCSSLLIAVSLSNGMEFNKTNKQPIKMNEIQLLVFAKKKCVSNVIIILVSVCNEKWGAQVKTDSDNKSCASPAEPNKEL